MKNEVQPSPSNQNNSALREWSGSSETSVIGSNHPILNPAKHKRSDFRPRFTGCAFRLGDEREREVLGASGKPVWTWPSVVAVDAGPMQIQLGEGRVWRCANAVPLGKTATVR